MHQDWMEISGLPSNG